MLPQLISFIEVCINLASLRFDDPLSRLSHSSEANIRSQVLRRFSMSFSIVGREIPVLAACGDT